MLIDSKGAHLAGELVCKRHVVGLEGARDVGGSLGAYDGAERLSGERVCGRVDAGDLDADRDVEVGGDVGERHGVENDALEVAMGFRGAGEVCELRRTAGRHGVSIRGRR